MKLVPRSLRVVLALAATTLLPAVGCSDSFGQLASTATIQVKLLPPSNPGTRKAKLPVTIDQPIPFTVNTAPPPAYRLVLSKLVSALNATDTPLRLIARSRVNWAVGALPPERRSRLSARPSTSWGTCTVPPFSASREQ